MCSKCQGTQSYKVQRTGRTLPLYECRTCSHQESLTAGTIFQHTRVALRVWFVAIFLMAMDKGGKSALTLSRELGLRYATAWLMPHKIQRAMADRNAKYQLAGLVELDDAYFGGASQSPWRSPRMARGSKGGEPTKIRWWWASV